jgi:hypothetical protein
MFEDEKRRSTDADMAGIERISRAIFERVG